MHNQILSAVAALLYLPSHAVYNSLLHHYKVDNFRYHHRYMPDIYQEPRDINLRQ